MKNNKRFIIPILWIILGATLLICSVSGMLDEFWGGMGSALLIIGVLRLIRYIRYFKCTEYRDTVDTETNDERNKFLSTKAWAWSGYLFIMIAGICTIVFKIIGHEDYMMIASGSICLIMLLYWISYLILKRKY